jgi:uncharacterized protein YdeI (YjbR/CyaY-like superfamily)
MISGSPPLAAGIHIENSNSFYHARAMPTRDPRIDAYITRAAGFAKPILNRIRKLVHTTCPKVEETIKWSSPFYEHKGILLATPAFKHHCALIFWKGRLFLSKDQKAKLRRLTSLSELPGDKILAGYIKKAAQLNESAIKNPARTKPKTKVKLVAPEYFLVALNKNKKALAGFERFSPSHKREYIEWITEARQAETRTRRMQTAITQMAEGKSRYWKYQQQPRQKG